MGLQSKLRAMTGGDGLPVNESGRRENGWEDGPSAPSALGIELHTYVDVLGDNPPPPLKPLCSPSCRAPPV